MFKKCLAKKILINSHDECDDSENSCGVGDDDDDDDAVCIVFKTCRAGQILRG